MSFRFPYQCPECEMEQIGVKCFYFKDVIGGFITKPEYIQVNIKSCRDCGCELVKL